jgi:hypothetical protein
MATGVGYPVDLVERVGEVGDAGDLCIHGLNRSPCVVEGRGDFQLLSSRHECRAGAKALLFPIPFRHD